MDDIVKRLRNVAEMHLLKYPCEVYGAGWIENEAASEIEQLRAYIEELEDKMEDLSDASKYDIESY